MPKLKIGTIVKINSNAFKVFKARNNQLCKIDSYGDLFIMLDGSSIYLLEDDYVICRHQELLDLMFF